MSEPITPTETALVLALRAWLREQMQARDLERARSEIRIEFSKGQVSALAREIAHAAEKVSS